MKWGQILSWAGAVFFLLIAFNGGNYSDRRQAIYASGMLFAVSLALRALDIWSSKK